MLFLLILKAITCLFEDEALIGLRVKQEIEKRLNEGEFFIHKHDNSKIVEVIFFDSYISIYEFDGEEKNKILDIPQELTSADLRAMFDKILGLIRNNLEQNVENLCIYLTNHRINTKAWFGHHEADFLGMFRREVIIHLQMNLKVNLTVNSYFTENHHLEISSKTQTRLSKFIFRYELSDFFRDKRETKYFCIVFPFESDFIEDLVAELQFEYAVRRLSNYLEYSEIDRLKTAGNRSRVTKKIRTAFRECFKNIEIEEFPQKRLERRIEKIKCDGKPHTPRFTSRLSLEYFSTLHKTLLKDLSAYQRGEIATCKIKGVCILLGLILEDTQLFEEIFSPIAQDGSPEQVGIFKHLQKDFISKYFSVNLKEKNLSLEDLRELFISHSPHTDIKQLSLFLTLTIILVEDFLKWIYLKF